MVTIDEEKWKKIAYIFNYLIPEETFKICPNCGMPYKRGYMCTACGCDPGDDDNNEDFYYDD